MKLITAILDGSKCVAGLASRVSVANMRNSPLLKSNVEFRIRGIEISGNSVIEMFGESRISFKPKSFIAPSSNS